MRGFKALLEDAREELNKSVGEERIGYRHSIKSLVGMGLHHTTLGYN